VKLCKVAVKEMKVAVIDNYNARRADLVENLDGVETNTVFDFAEITRSEFENGEFDVALVHESNPEAASLLNEAWESKDVRLIFFSGGYSEAISKDDDLIFVSQDELFKRLPDLSSLLGFEP
jgi:hypothetical protein